MFRVFANTASIKQNGICLLGIIRQFVTVFPQRSNNQLAVEHIHLAAYSLNVQLAIVVTSCGFDGHNVICLQEASIEQRCWYEIAEESIQTHPQTLYG